MYNKMVETNLPLSTIKLTTCDINIPVKDQ